MSYKISSHLLAKFLSQTYSSYSSLHFFADICCLSVQGQGQGGGKNIIGGPIVAEEVNIIDGALKFR